MLAPFAVGTVTPLTNQCLPAVLKLTAHDAFGLHVSRQLDNDCAAEAKCTGRSARCPSIKSPDKTPCHCKDDNCTANPNTNPQVCTNGVCDVFICELYGGTQCGLAPPRSCELGCRGGGWGNGDSCISTFDSSNRPKQIGQGRHLIAGTPCNGYKGICDHQGDCDRANPIDTKKAPEPFTEVWFNKHWKYFVIGAVVLIGAMLVLKHITFNTSERRMKMLSERATLLEAANHLAELEELEYVYR